MFPIGNKLAIAQCFHLDTFNNFVINNYYELLNDFLFSYYCLIILISIWKNNSVLKGLNISFEQVFY